MRTSDHGDLLGAHGGLHQKWFNLYDEATRVPFLVARIGARADDRRTRQRRARPRTSTWCRPCSSAAGIDADGASPPTLRDGLHRGAPAARPRPDAGRRRPDARRDADRAVYLITRDNMLEGDTGLSGLARQLGRKADPPAAAADPGRRPRRRQLRGRRRPGRHVPTGRPPVEAGPHLRRPRPPGPSPDAGTSRPTAPPVRSTAPSRCPTSGSSTTSTPTRSSRSTAGTTPTSGEVFAQPARPGSRRSSVASVPERNTPWPYVARRQGEPDLVRPPKPARALRRLAQRLGMHPDDDAAARQRGAGSPGAGDRDQPRHPRRRHAHRRLRLRADRAVLLLRGRRDVRRRGEPARRRDPGRPDVAEAGAPHRGRRPLPRRRHPALQAAGLPGRSPTSTSPTTTWSTSPAAGARPSTSATPSRSPTR